MIKTGVLSKLIDNYKIQASAINSLLRDGKPKPKVYIAELRMRRKTLNEVVKELETIGYITE